MLVSGRAIGNRIGSGPVRLVKSAARWTRVEPGDVLVTDMTDPDWEPVMKRAAAIVTNRGGRTCHAAIIARELGIPAVVGCGDATEQLREGEAGDRVLRGRRYRLRLPRACSKWRWSICRSEAMPKAPVKISMNVGNPELAFDFQRLAQRGHRPGAPGVHHRAHDRHASARRCSPIRTCRPICGAIVEARSGGYADPSDLLRREAHRRHRDAWARRSAPKPVIVRLSDFKSNEYSSLLGRPALRAARRKSRCSGFRGASRYIDPSFRDCFELECRALKKVRDEMGLTNVEIMVPFVRTVTEAEQVIESAGGQRPEARRERPAHHHDVRDSFQRLARRAVPGALRRLFDRLQRHDAADARRWTATRASSPDPFDERDPAVKHMLHMAIQACRKAGKYVGICGQGPSDHPGPGASGWWRRASKASRSIRTRWSRPGCFSPASGKASAHA